jgi:hypothetical protein
MRFTHVSRHAHGRMFERSRMDARACLQNLERVWTRVRRACMRFRDFPGRLYGRGCFVAGCLRSRTRSVFELRRSNEGDAPNTSISDHLPRYRVQR